MVANQELVKNLRRRFIVEGYKSLTKAEKIALIDEQAILIDEQAERIAELKETIATRNDDAKYITRLQARVAELEEANAFYQGQAADRHSQERGRIAEQAARIAELEAQVKKMETEISFCPMCNTDDLAENLQGGMTEVEYINLVTK